MFEKSTNMFSEIRKSSTPTSEVKCSMIKKKRGLIA